METQTNEDVKPLTHLSLFLQKNGFKPFNNGLPSKLDTVADFDQCVKLMKEQANDKFFKMDLQYIVERLTNISDILRKLGYPKN